MKILLIIAAYGYGGSPLVSTQTFENIAYCEAAKAELKKHKYSTFFASEPSYECVELKPTPSETKE